MDEKQCPLAESKYCRILNMRSCEQCTVRDSADFNRVMQDLERYETLLPEGGISWLFTEPACRFCREEPENRHGYAILYMAHPEPKHLQQHLIGKRASAFGTMIPLQFGICDRCRKRLLTLEYLPTVLPLTVGIIGLIVVYLTDLKDHALGVGTPWPLILWSAAVLAAWIGGRLLARMLVKRWDREMRTDVMEHPTVREMLELGWYPIARQSRTKLMFSRSRLTRGLGTAIDETNGNERN